MTKNIRKLCKQEGVAVLWGLELLTKLHKMKGISTKKVQTLVKKIQQFMNKIEVQAKKNNSP